MENSEFGWKNSELDLRNLYFLSPIDDTIPAIEQPLRVVYVTKSGNSSHVYPPRISSLTPDLCVAAFILSNVPTLRVRFLRNSCRDEQRSLCQRQEIIAVGFLASGKRD